MVNPYCLAMILCDGVHRDPGTMKHTILGTFSAFMSNEYPTEFTFFVYAAITELEGPCTVGVRLVDSEFESDPKIVTAPPIDVESPLAVLELAFGIKANLPKPGEYHCELLVNEELVMARRIIAILSEKGP